MDNAVGQAIQDRPVALLDILARRIIHTIINASQARMLLHN
jgi:hypothetical protein